MYMKPFALYIMSACALFLSACSGGRASQIVGQGDTLVLRYADNLTLVVRDGYIVATLRNPWDTLRTLHTYVLVPREEDVPARLSAGVTVVRTPLQRAVVYSSVHCGLLHELGAGSAIGGVCDLRYIKLPAVHRAVDEGKVVDCGNGMNPDMERIIDLHPDAILLSPFENSGGYGRVGKLGVPVVECADYMETSALGRAEWMRFYGLLFGVEQQADSLFARLEADYLNLKKQVMQAAERPTVVCELKSGSAWYVPGGRSTTGRILADAGARYAFAEDGHSGSVPLAFESVFDRAGEADVWLFKYNRAQNMTYGDLRSDYVGYTAFKAYKQRNIYACNTGEVPFYEETPFHPDLLLADLIRILHPGLLSGSLRYYKKLEE